MRSGVSGNRGSILLVLIVGALAATLAAVVAGLSLNQLSLATKSESKGRCEAAGESVSSLALFELQDDPDFGQLGHPDQSRLFSWTGPEGEQGLLTFDQDVADANGIEVSVNNLNGANSVLSNGTEVADGLILLRGNGVWGGAKGVIEILVHRPPYPYAISSTGAVDLNGNAVVGQMPASAKADDFVSSPPKKDADDLLPAHVRANGSITLTGNIVVQGDVTSNTTVSVAGASQVNGDIITNGGTIAIPALDVTSLEPAPGRFESVASNSLNAPNLVGYHKYDAGVGLLVLNGLTLNDGILYVDGDLTIHGGIHGMGAVVATGDVTIQGETQVTGLERMALIAEGSILLQGSGTAQFQGAVYANGDITARNMIVAGTVIGGGSGGSRVLLDSAILAEADSTVDLGVKSQGFHRDGFGVGYALAADFGPNNYSYLEEAELVAPDRVRLRRFMYHPNIGTQGLGLGEVELSTGTVVSGDLSDATRGNGARAIIDMLNGAPRGTMSEMMEQAGWTIPVSPLQALHFINFYNGHSADDFSWLQARFPPNPVTGAENFRFVPSQFLAPAERLSIISRRTKR